MSTQTTHDSNAVRQSMRAQWNQAAKGWADSGPKIQQWLADATAAMLAMAAIKPGDRVLDVAAGAGAQTLDIAARVGVAGHVLATDLSPDILERAKAAAADAGYRNVDIRVSDGEK